MRIIRQVKYSVSNELTQGAAIYLTGLFFFLAGIASGVTCYLRAGVSLGAGDSMSIFTAIVLSAAPFALMIMCSPFFVGIPGLCAVMLWQGLLFGCGPVLSMALLQMALCIPTIFFMYRKCLTLSLSWCKIKRATPHMRILAVTQLLPPAFVCVLIGFISRIPVCFFGAC